MCEGRGGAARLTFSHSCLGNTGPLYARRVLGSSSQGEWTSLLPLSPSERPVKQRECLKPLMSLQGVCFGRVVEVRDLR